MGNSQKRKAGAEAQAPQVSHPAPTVGRMVHYYPGGAEEEIGNRKGQPYAAVVTHVFEDSVDLHVFSTRPYLIGDRQTDVRYSVLPMPGHWTWPPRTEAPARAPEPASSAASES